MNLPDEEILGSTQKRRKRRRKCIGVALLFVALVLVIGVFVWWLSVPRVAAGSRIIPTFTSDVNEAQAVLDDYAQQSRITVSLIPYPSFDEETGTLALNFVVSDENNGFAERFVIEQEGQIVYESECVQPGYALETIEAPRIHVGQATATVYAVDEQGNDCGNPIAVELDIRAQAEST